MRIQRCDNGLGEDDFNALSALVDAVQAGEPYYDSPGVVSASTWLAGACEDSSSVFVARDSGKIVGYLLAQPFESYRKFYSSPVAYGVHPTSCLYLSELGVAERARGKGIGASLVNTLLAEAKETQCSILVRTLHHVHGTQRLNPAIEFYERLAFRLVMSGDGPLIESGPALRNKPRVFLRWTP